MTDDGPLTPTYFVDSDAAAVREFAAAAIGPETSAAGRAVRLFATVRDAIWYDPFSCSEDPADYRASAVATSARNWCVPKAVLLTAAARSVGIPARLGFADVRNHFQTPRLRERMRGQDVFVFHGYSEMLLEDRWVKATPAFNAELCARFGVAPIEFDGEHDALLHQYGPGGEEYMEYLHDRGTFDDLPLRELLATFHEVYGPELTRPAGQDETGDATADEFTAPDRET